MRLENFIRTEIELILQDWEEFAETILHASHLGKGGLRDHAKDMLLAIADDLDSGQSESEQAEKSKSHGPEQEQCQPHCTQAPGIEKQRATDKYDKHHFQEALELFLEDQ